MIPCWLLLSFVELILCDLPTEHTPTLYLNIVEHGSGFNCIAAEATVMAGKPMTIHFNHKEPIYKIRCYQRLGEHVRSIWKQNFIPIDYVYPDMDSVWSCTIVTSPRNTFPSSQRTENCEGYTCSVIDCKINLHVWCADQPPQAVLVNGILLPRRQSEVRGSCDELAEYFYNDGDLVDVTCANVFPVLKSQACYLYMTYDYIAPFRNVTNKGMAKQNGPGNTIGVYNGSIYANPVGFKLRMQAANDNTYAVCNCQMYPATNVRKDSRKVRVNFYMNKVNKVDVPSLYVYINGAALRATTDKEGEYNYQFIPYEYINVECRMAQLGHTLQFKWLSKPLNTNTKVSSSRTRIGASFYLNTTESPSFQCMAQNKIIKVYLKPRDVIQATYNCPLSTRLKNSDVVLVEPLLELYQYRKRDLIYRYKDGDTFRLTCSSLCDQERGYAMYLLDSGGHYINSEKNIKLNSTIIHKDISSADIDKDNVVECRIIDESHTVQDINTLVFVRLPITAKTTIGTSPTRTETTIIHGSTSTKTTIGPTTTDVAAATTAVTDDAKGIWLIALGGVATCLIIFGVIVVIYKLRNWKNNRSNPHWSPGDVNYENLPREETIPPFPPQWESRTNNNENNEEAPIYCEANTVNQLYSMPVPKRERKSPNKHIDQTYEVVDQSKAVGNTINDLTYVEIMHSDQDTSKAKTLLKTQVNENTPYAVIVQQDNCGVGLNANSSKYANAQELVYANANVRNEYADPRSSTRQMDNNASETIR